MGQIQRYTVCKLSCAKRMNSTPLHSHHPLLPRFLCWGSDLFRTVWMGSSIICCSVVDADIFIIPYCLIRRYESFRLLSQHFCNTVCTVDTAQSMYSYFPRLMDLLDTLVPVLTHISTIRFLLEKQFCKSPLLTDGSFSEQNEFQTNRTLRIIWSRELFK